MTKKQRRLSVTLERRKRNENGSTAGDTSHVEAVESVKAEVNVEQVDEETNPVVPEGVDEDDN